MGRIEWTRGDGQAAAPEVNVNAIDWKDRTPLFHAAARGHEAVVKLVLSTSKAQVTYKDRHGDTPLSIATANRHEAIILMLRDRVPKESQIL